MKPRIWTGVRAELNVHMPRSPCNESRKPFSSTCRRPADWSHQRLCNVALHCLQRRLCLSHVGGFGTITQLRPPITITGLTAVQRVRADLCLTNESAASTLPKSNKFDEHGPASFWLLAACAIDGVQSSSSLRRKASAHVRVP